MQHADAPSEQAVDVVIVGGGIAGLAAAWKLRHRNCVVLEAGDRPGGRIHSIGPIDQTINLGAHMVPGGDDSVIGQLVAETNLSANPLPPNLFGLQYQGRRHLSTPSFLLPLAMRLSMRERVAFARLGYRLRLGAGRSIATGKRQDGEGPDAYRRRVAEFEDTRTLSDFVGSLPPRVDAIFHALTERTGATPDEMTAGHGLRSFANVWEKTAPGTNLVGGTAALPQELAHQLGSRFQPAHKVVQVQTQRGKNGDFVRVSYEANGQKGAIVARTCILATPAHVTRDIAVDLVSETHTALEKIRYGAFLSVGVRLDGGARLPWQDTYAIATPGLGFSVLFNHDAMLPDAARADGHSMMLFRGAAGAAEWIENGTTAIATKWVEDLEVNFPEIRGRIKDVVPMPWATGAPYATPGRAGIQAALEREQLPYALAGDYLEFPNMEAAASSGVSAASRIERFLESELAPDPSRIGSSNRN